MGLHSERLGAACQRRITPRPNPAHPIQAVLIPHCPLPTLQVASATCTSSKRRAAHLLPQGVELPAHERVVVRINVRRDEGSSPVDAAAERLDVLHGEGWEVIQPVL